MSLKINRWMLQLKLKKIQLRFIDSIIFRASSLDSLSSNLVGVSGMVFDNYGGSCEFTHVNDDYIAHGKYRNCYLRQQVSTKHP